MTDDLRIFQDSLVRWLGESSLFPGQDLHIDLILNPFAGAFRHHRQRAAILGGFRQARDKLPGGDRTGRQVKVTTWTTEYPGHEQAILAHLHSADPCGPADRRLVVTAGGDGTSRGALISALRLPETIRESLTFFRLPLGTGNDAAETRDWVQALEFLSGRSPVPLAVSPLRFIEIQVPTQPVHHSFNIASVGLDAFVVHMTNHLKDWLPGNSYSLMVDVAAFFYEIFVRVVPSVLELTNRGQTTFRWDKPFLLAALGVSGHRTYGAGKRILPDRDNFCMAGKKNIFSKLAYRKPFYTGTHRGLDGIHLAAGDHLTVVSPVRIPLQMDGEVLWLGPGDFPVAFSVVDRGLKVLSPTFPLPLNPGPSKL